MLTEASLKAKSRVEKRQKNKVYLFAALKWEFIKENMKVRKKKENKNSTNKVIKKKRNFFFLGRFLGRVLVFFLFFLFS